ncbi:MAG: Gfo/Idh/MocA family oxidoreductase [Candidatus Marinimicrobia bacterium]|nr:Gfo/Idh/MocA family oxidoreductase [Candidatus Neomarinimicrobiota bacterium]
MSVIEAVLIGAGQRGRDAFGGFALRNPNELKFVAVAEPNDARRKRFGDEHQIPKERRYSSYEELLAEPQMAPLCFIATLDAMHLPVTRLAFKQGYHLFLEKPMADTPEGCVEIARLGRKAGRMIQICHPLRYTPFYSAVKRKLNEGAIGRLVSLTMAENVGYWHYSHSYVRGNWSRVEDTGPLILTKCCHDMDLASWLVGSKAEAVASFGGQTCFIEENAPEGATKRCLDGCLVEAECPFSALAIYLKDKTDWPVSAISTDSSLEGRRKALEIGPYGRCVYHCDNTAVDHQVVTAQFSNGVSFDFAVRANSFHCYRTIRALGVEGELNGHMEHSEFTITRFSPGWGMDERIEVQRVPASLEGHSGGDSEVIRNFLRCYRESDFDSIQESLDIAVEGHLLAFAAEEARRQKQTIALDQYRSRFI